MVYYHYCSSPYITLFFGISEMWQQTAWSSIRTHKLECYKKTLMGYLIVITFLRAPFYPDDETNSQNYTFLIFINKRMIIVSH